MPLRLTNSPGQLRCSSCGYNLAGVGTGQVISECPNCGSPFDPGDGARPRRWPATWTIALALSGGMILLGLLYSLAWFVQRGSSPTGPSDFAKELVFILNQCVLPVWFLSPLIGSTVLAQRYAYRGERWMIGLGLSIAGIVGNTVLALCFMLISIVTR